MNCSLSIGGVADERVDRAKLVEPSLHHRLTLAGLGHAAHRRHPTRAALSTFTATPPVHRSLRGCSASRPRLWPRMRDRPPRPLSRPPPPPKPPPPPPPPLT